MSETFTNPQVVHKERDPERVIPFLSSPGHPTQAMGNLPQVQPILGSFSHPAELLGSQAGTWSKCREQKHLGERRFPKGRD